jgi:hypothetical protein
VVAEAAVEVLPKVRQTVKKVERAIKGLLSPANSLEKWGRAAASAGTCMSYSHSGFCVKWRQLTNKHGWAVN